MAEKLEIAGKLSKEEIDWIRSKADWIDPIVSSTDELLGIRNHDNSREQKEQYLSEKRYYWWLCVFSFTECSVIGVNY